VWCDLETTGLRPDRDAVLEIYMVKANFEEPFTPLGEPFHRIFRVFPYEGLSQTVLEMHSKSGLWAECMVASVPPGGRSSHVHDMLTWLGADGLEREEKPVLAGSSVHFDLAFLRNHFPDFTNRLSHRVYDVSAITLFLQSIGVTKPFPKGEQPHRAKDDVIASMARGNECARRWGI
jgi:oligoribonuclease